MNNFDDFLKVIKKCPKVRNKMNDLFDRYNRLSEIGCDSLIPNVILKELKNIMGTTIPDLDIELKSKLVE